jgi:hypothetical protein
LAAIETAFVAAYHRGLAQTEPGRLLGEAMRG